MNIKLICGFIFTLIISLMVLNTFLLKKRETLLEPLQHGHTHGTFSFELKRKELLSRFRECIQIQTISPEVKNETRWEEFTKIHQWLEKTYRKVYHHLDVIRVGERNMSVIYIWKGSQLNLKPLMWTSHLDVVPIEKGTESMWVTDPFEGKTLDDGFMYGRGTMDTKMGILGIMESVESLLEQNYIPRHTIIIAFGHDEEVGGPNGAKYIAKWLLENNYKPEFIHDEGSLIIKGIIPGIERPVATIGTSEKGFGTIEVRADTKGGHASMPPSESSIGVLSQAITKIEANPIPGTFAGSMGEFFDFLAPHMSLLYRFLFANRFLFESLILKVFESDPIKSAAVRTTQATTIIRGGFKNNVLPKSATALLNIRIHPHDDLEGVMKRMRKIINDPRITISDSQSLGSRPSSPVSSSSSRSFQILEQTLYQWNPDVLVAPTLFLANTDTVHYWNLTENIFRFSPILVSREDISRIHGINERIDANGFHELVEFYYHWMLNADAFINSSK